MTNLTTLTYHNMGFMGSWRENESNLDGHYRIITDGKEFGIISCNDYGGFEYVGDPKDTDLNESGYRVFHDVIINDYHFRGLIYSESTELESIWINIKKYKLHDKNISKNIQYGDKVIDLLNGETFIVGSEHDRMYIIRNHNYKLVDRPELHPEPMTKNDFMVKQLESEKNVIQKYRWSEFEGKFPKNGENWLYMFWLVINGVKYEFGADYSSQVKYYMTFDGKVYTMSSNISSPFYDTVDVLIGLVYVEYIDGCRMNFVIHDVESSINISTFGDYPKYHLTKFTDEVSYRYNTRNTYL